MWGGINPQRVGREQGSGSALGVPVTAPCSAVPGRRIGNAWAVLGKEDVRGFGGRAGGLRQDFFCLDCHYQSLRVPACAGVNGSERAAAAIGRLASQTRDDDELLVWARAGACGERAVRPVSLDAPTKRTKGEPSDWMQVSSLFSVRVGGFWMFGFGARQVVMPEGRDLLLGRCARERDGGIVA